MKPAPITDDPVARVALMVAAGFVALSLVLLAGWLSPDDEGAPDAVPAPRVAAAPVAPQLAPGVPLGQEPTAASVPQAVGAAPVAVAERKSVELCGMGRVPLPAGLPASAAAGDLLDGLPAPIGQQALASALGRTLLGLPTLGPRGVAVAVLLRAPDVVPLGPAPEALASLALSGRDATVTRWAIARCGAAAFEGPRCKELGAEAWVKAEPDNAAAWLTLLAHKPTASADATAGLARSTRFSEHSGRLVGTMIDAVPADLPDYLRSMVALDALGVEAALPAQSYQTASTLCRLREGEPRPPVCTLLARLMMETGDTALAQQIGARIAEWNGAPAAQHQAVRERVARQQSRASEIIGNETDSLGCDAVRGMLGVWRAWPQLGELEAWRLHPRFEPRR